MPGITPLVAEFGRRVAAAGMTAVLPNLFGTPGRPPTSAAFATSMARTCISRGVPRPRRRQVESGDAVAARAGSAGARSMRRSRVGVVGMCFTGGFALAMMVDPVVVAR